jgi:hypothetical protein
MDAPLRPPFRNSDRTLIGRAVNSRRRNAQATANLRAAGSALDRRSELGAKPEYPNKGGSRRAQPDSSSAIDITVIEQQIVSLQLPQRVAGPTCRWSPAPTRISTRQGMLQARETELWSKTQSNNRTPQLQSLLDPATKPETWKKVTLVLTLLAAVGALVGGFLLRTWIEAVPATIASAASGAAAVLEPSYSPQEAVDTSQRETGPAASSAAEASPEEPSQSGTSPPAGTTKQEAAVAPSLPTPPAVTSTQAAAVDGVANAPQPDTATKAQGTPAAVAEPLTVHLRIDARLAPEQRRRIETMLAKAGYGSVVVHEMPFSISRSRVGFFRETDRASAEALISALQGTLDGLELRDYHEYMAEPEDHRLDLWIKS